MPIRLEAQSACKKGQRADERFCWRAIKTSCFIVLAQKDETFINIELKRSLKLSHIRPLKKLR